MSLKPLIRNPLDAPHPEFLGAEGSGVTDLTRSLRKIDSAPSHANDDGQQPLRQIPVDLIEEESMESFPASDPPGHHKASA